MIVTFDLGTTRLKVAAFHPNGNLLGQVSLRNTEHQAGDQRWQSADEWWANCSKGFRQLMAEFGLRVENIIGFSLSGRAGACVFVGKDGNVLIHPWSDNRHASGLSDLQREAPTTPHYAATMLAKFLQVRHSQPEIAAKTQHLFYAKDFLLFRLTGKSITDPASGPDAPSWDSALLSQLDIDPEILPECQSPTTIAGPLIQTAATALGCPAGIPVAVGAHDGVCANTGAGAVDSANLAITLGTHAVVRAVMNSHPAGSLRFYGYPGDKHVIGGNALMAGRALDWFLDNWQQDDVSARPQTFADMNARASNISPGSDGISFLPYLGGQLSPRRRPRATALFHGLSFRHTTDHMYRAVLEGTAFGLACAFAQVIGWVGAPQTISLTGSGILGTVWTQMIADILQHELLVTDASSEGRGAAIFCAIALGYHASISDATSAMVNISGCISPDPSRTAAYAELFAQWTELEHLASPMDRVRT